MVTFNGDSCKAVYDSQLIQLEPTLSLPSISVVMYCSPAAMYIYEPISKLQRPLLLSFKSKFLSDISKRKF